MEKDNVYIEVKGKSKCPFCGGTKTKPFVGKIGKGQECNECDKNGNIKNSILQKLGLSEFIISNTKK